MIKIKDRLQDFVLGDRPAGLKKWKLTPTAIFYMDKPKEAKNTHDRRGAQRKSK